MNNTRFTIRDSSGTIIYHNLTEHTKVDGFGWQPGAGFVLWDDIQREGWTVETTETRVKVTRHA
jgi:hypothetical protein